MTGAAERLRSINSRIRSACLRCGRDPEEITLVGAAKRQDSARLLEAREAGLADFGENLVQEAESHRELLGDADVNWHLIGPLQSNKARRAARLFDWIHSVDRLKIARRLDGGAAEAGRRIRAMAEVNLGAEPTKHGFAPSDLVDVAGELLAFENLEVVGLMAIPPRTDTEDECRAWFSRLRELRDRVFSGPGQGLLSMGMSGDFEIAIEEGATHIRIGTELFGPRAPRSEGGA